MLRYAFLKRGMSRVFFHFARMLLRAVEAMSPRVFMVLYTALLTKMGLHFTGKPRFISTLAKFDDFTKIRIGDRAVISQDVMLLTHDYSVTTAMVATGVVPETDFCVIREIVIGDNVFVGIRSLLLPGCVLGDNVIVGAGAVVRGTIPPNSIVVGNPALVVSSTSDASERWLTAERMAGYRVDTV